MAFFLFLNLNPNNMSLKVVEIKFVKVHRSEIGTKKDFSVSRSEYVAAKADPENICSGQVLLCDASGNGRWQRTRYPEHAQIGASISGSVVTVKTNTYSVGEGDAKRDNCKVYTLILAEGQSIAEAFAQQAPEGVQMLTAKTSAIEEASGL